MKTVNATKKTINFFAGSFLLICMMSCIPGPLIATRSDRGSQVMRTWEYDSDDEGSFSEILRRAQKNVTKIFQACQAKDIERALRNLSRLSEKMSMCRSKDSLFRKLFLDDMEGRQLLFFALKNDKDIFFKPFFEALTKCLGLKRLRVVVNQHDEMGGETPLFKAARVVGKAELLLEAGANPFVICSGSTPLIRFLDSWPTRKHYKESFKRVLVLFINALREGASYERKSLENKAFKRALNLRDDHGRTALYYLIEKCNEETLDKSIIKMLAKAGLNILQKDNRGITLVDLALKNRKKELASYLLKYGQRYYQQISSESESSSSQSEGGAAARLSDSSDEDFYGCRHKISRFKAKKTSDSDDDDASFGYVFQACEKLCLRSKDLHQALGVPYVEVAYALLAQDFDVFKKNSKQRTLLHSACIGGNFELVKAVINYADVWEQDDLFRTPFHYAYSLADGPEKDEIIELLLEKLNSEDNEALVRWCIDIKDIYGKRAFEYQ